MDKIMNRQKAKRLRKLEAKLSKDFFTNYMRDKDSFFERAEPMTDELIDELMTLKGMHEADLRYMQKEGHRYSRERDSFLSPEVLFG